MHKCVISLWNPQSWDIPKSPFPLDGPKLITYFKRKEVFFARFSGNLFVLKWQESQGFMSRFCLSLQTFVYQLVRSQNNKKGRTEANPEKSSRRKKIACHV